MKKIVTLLTFFVGLISFFALALACHQQEVLPDMWQKVNTPYFGKPLDIKFTSADTGYILGAKYSDDSIYNILIKTFDGGQIWKSIRYTDPKFLTQVSGGLMQSIYVSPFNPNIVFSGGNLNMLRSTDGGQHWYRVDTVNRLSTPNMYFFSPANGLCSTGNRICQTIDSGLNWTSIFKYPSMIGFHLLPFTSKQVGYFAGGIEFDGGSGGIMGKTTDGGNTWSLIDYPFDDIVSVSFVNDSIGYVSMLTAEGNIGTTYLGYKFIKTRDGGKTWKVIRQTPNDNKSTGYYNLYFKTELEGYCTINGIFHTTDGGKTWKKESAIQASALCFPDQHTCYAIDVNGIVYKRLF